MTPRSIARASLLVGGLALMAVAPLAALDRPAVFHSQGVELHGSLLLPERPAPAAFALLHGSGCETREALRQMAEEMRARGFAALIFDQRGCGESTGSWVDASLDDLAADANAAARWLREQPEIPAGAPVGVWGNSHSGWVAPRASLGAGSPIGFVIVTTGGGIPPEQLERAAYRNALAHQGADLDQLPAAQRLLDLYFGYLRTGERRSELLAAIAAAQKEPWGKALDLSRVVPTQEGWRVWQWISTYDPATDLAALRAPTLVLLGGKDMLAPTPEVASAWTRGLSAAPSHGSRVVLFADAGHGITLGGHHTAGPHAYAPGYFDLVAEWLRALVVAPPAPQAQPSPPAGD